MLSAEENELLTSVGAGTTMGALLRRYWTPACLSSEIPEPDSPPVRVRLLSEDLVAFRGTDHRVGLIQENCPHRGASLYFGRNEDCGLRCVYHGWKFDLSGQCVDMPSEPRPFAERIKATAYPTHESGGIVWAYLGPPESMTPFRDFGTESLAADQVMASKLYVDCNWVQSIEGNIDTAHISFLHTFNAVDDIPDDGSDMPGYPSDWVSMKFRRHDRAPRLEIQDEPYGFRYAGLRRTPNGHTHVRMSAYIFPYSTVIAAVPFNTQQIWTVPIDDNRTWRYTFANAGKRAARRTPGVNWRLTIPNYPFRGLPNSGIVPREYTAENEYQLDREAQRTSSFSGVPNIVAQDLMVTESMSPIYDRRNENLGTTDLAITRMRTQLMRAARDLQAGIEPPALDPSIDYLRIRSAEKVLEAGEDWRRLGTDEDPAVREALLADRP
jgi:phthalate 4,5-dioxygenase oxygenase subunit